VAVPQIKGAAAAVVQMKEEFRQKTEAEASKLPNELREMANLPAARFLWVRAVHGVARNYVVDAPSLG
jgi:hypothetical protein